MTDNLTQALNLHDLERMARATLEASALDYYEGGSGDERTVRENLEAFARLRLRPRVLVDVSSLDLSTTVLGQEVSLPVLAAPTAFHGLAHPEAEVATARGVAAAGSIMTLSTFSNRDIEEVGAAANGRLWFQLYVYRDREVSEALVRRAEAAGARALVVTVDTPYAGYRERDVRNGFRLPEHLSVRNADPRLDPLESDLAVGSQISGYFQRMLDPSLSWKDVAWLASITRLPVLLKGILTAEDALLAAEHGAAGVIVSNHGGRQLDSAIATIDALPEIAGAAGDRLEVLMDGGVRRGTDVLKALALGARAVMLGRPVLWGLSVGGEGGVRLVLELLREELRLALALSGHASVREVQRSLVVR
ncbi:isopentenyl diphosphate isomerase/L-lactate dehydrogenase-like FMN-dependent dehydrogenase [Deinobacterium chartae]|uniref:Isopentenyl diphosphate isomerase/L-lactate dehydrogenase-like FMN-dependent dehydrogenase n=1 Tax=Deinobacterium chartae TaxID=521158 RepID=A0A841I265_9DEIO|nr:alpha-hydroxy acid oxidase [Deinobacterium chartae]MBB6098500.1 isopentenyl diphosphate isomerase/L-lactate dehydrogenase-like FMN-dependent dehydrogenase [Deinobacterium chartae]